MLYEINYLDIEENEIYETIISKAIEKCFEIENLGKSNLYVNIILTNPSHIREYNKQYRNIDKETDVLSFPMFEKQELEEKITKKQFEVPDILGDMVLSIPKIKEQAQEFENTFERELSYMVVHSFYHLLGYDHMQEEDKKIMRQKEENVLSKMGITRE